MKRIIGIIADDLTGSGDAGLLFADSGLKTLIQVTQDDNDIHPEESPDVFIINTDSRSDEPEEAYSKVRAAGSLLKEMDADKIYKKIDSTLRGNLGSEIDALFDEFEVDAIPFCAAFPAMGRTTVKGWHYVRGKLITQTEFAGDPGNPVREAHIPALLKEQTKNSERIIVFDAENDKDLKKIAGEIVKADYSVVVGAAGLAGELLEAWTGRKAPRKKDESAGKNKEEQGTGNPVLIVSGSRNPVSYAQVERLKKNKEVINIPINFSENKVKLANWLEMNGNNQDGNSGGRSMVIYPDPDSGDVSPETVMNVISQLALKLCGSGLFKNLVLSGGDTALNICRALKVSAMDVVHSVMPGVAFCRDTENRYGIILKPGGFGDEDTLVKCYEYFK